MDELQSGGRSRITEFPLSASEPNMAPVLSEPASACYLAVGRLIRGELSPPADQIDTHAVLATARISWMLLAVSNRATSTAGWEWEEYRVPISNFEELVSEEIATIASGKPWKAMCWELSEAQPSRGACVPDLCARHGPTDTASWEHIAEVALWLFRQRPDETTPKFLDLICQELWHADYRYTIMHDRTTLNLNKIWLGTWATAFDDEANDAAPGNDTWHGGFADRPTRGLCND